MSNQSEHTPGPWHNASDEWIADESGDLICHFKPLYWPQDEMRSAEEVTANMKLIAAAPDLLEALSFYVSLCGNTGYSVTRETFKEMYEKGTAALKKAIGE